LEGSIAVAGSGVKFLMGKSGQTPPFKIID